MEDPSSSKMNVEDAIDADMEVEQSAAVPRKRNHPADTADDNMSDASSYESDEGFRPSRSSSHRRLAVGCQGIPSSSANYGKKMKLNCGHSSQSADYYDDESSDCSSSSVSSHSEEIYVQPRYVAPTSANYPNIHEPDAEPGPMNYNNADHLLHGYWIIFTNMQGGWPYGMVKMFLHRQLKVEAIRGKPWPGTEPGPDDFRLIASFSTQAERAKILKELQTRKASTHFAYVVTDTLPIGSYDFDRDAEDDQRIEVLRQG